MGLSATSSSHTSTFYDVIPILDDALIMVAARMVTHAMHLDELTDMADALDSYKPPEGVQEVLRDLSTDPMDVGSIVLTTLTTATAFVGIVTSVLV